MINKSIHLRKYLLPISWLYGLIVWLRNKFFDWGIFKQVEYDVPIICVGNITVGGTGKTPHTEYVVSVLLPHYKVAVLSRGYMRKTKGFVLADQNSTSREIGDEPYQIKNKYPELILAVDSNRRRGIEKLLALDTPPDVIVLDDGFQHRYVKPSYVILLSNFNRPIYNDKLLPVGLLRESKQKMYTANAVVISKCPNDLLPIDYRILTHDIDILPFQDLYFTAFHYKQLSPIFTTLGASKDLEYLANKQVLLVTGIASPAAIISELENYSINIQSITYKDHHTFSKKDIKNINTTFEAINSSEKVIIITEKDASKLSFVEGFTDEVKANMYSLPIEVSFSSEKDKIKFNNKILQHVKENSRNSRLHQKQG